MTGNVEIYFSDCFGVTAAQLRAHGAFNISLINDLPLFIDPFLLFNSKKPKYRELHDQIIRYVKFLRDKSISEPLTPGLIDAWFTFPEVKQNWLGFSKRGNAGSGLGREFAQALHSNLKTVFTSFGLETITKGSHLEKLTLIRDGVGRDNISDFVATLIKGFLLEYTEAFAKDFIGAHLRGDRNVARVSFNYETETWESRTFNLPIRNGDFVLLTPKEILTKDDTWINRPELLRDFETIVDALPNSSLRSLINNFFRQRLPTKATKDEIRDAKVRTLQEHPEIVEHYIRGKEDDGDRAKAVSDDKVRQSESLFVDRVQSVVTSLQETTDFYKLSGSTYDEALQRINFLKNVIENKDGYRIFWLDGEPIIKEEYVQIMYRLTWFATPSDVNREVNNGRGSADFAISRGSSDKNLVEFKLASNSKLKRNLQNQTAIYEKASDAQRSLKVVVYFTESELIHVETILKDVGLSESKEIILIDARRDNKPSASNV